MFLRSLSILLLALASLMITPDQTEAQCPMCRASAESNLRSGGQAATGLNQGIAYLLFMPYLMLGTLGLIWWNNVRSVAEQERDEEIISLLAEYDYLISKSKNV